MKFDSKLNLQWYASKRRLQNCERFARTTKIKIMIPHYTIYTVISHDDVIKWKHFLCYWPFLRGIHRSLVNSPHKGRWRGALMFSLICTWIDVWVNNPEAGDLRRHRSHYDVVVMRWAFRCPSILATVLSGTPYTDVLWPAFDCLTAFSGSHTPVTGGMPHKGPVAFPCHDVIMPGHLRGQ